MKENIKLNLKEICFGNMDWIKLSQDWVQHVNSQHASSRSLVNILAWKVMQSLLSSSLHYIMSLLTAPEQTDGEHKVEQDG
jgi:hypothetical protein